jgi:nucleotide exchange factor SIL1
VTKEWQRLGENDTIPAGMHVRMDLTTGEKWVKLITDDDNNDGGGEDVILNAHDGRMNPNMDGTVTSDGGGTDRAASVSVAILPEDGSVRVQEGGVVPGGSPTDGTDQGPGTRRYDYEMIHRTLSKLPEEEKERMGGLPELPQPGDGGIKLTSKEREALEKRLQEIWERRQEELARWQEMVMDMPDLLRERIMSIDGYLKDPQEQLKSMDLDAEVPEGTVTHIVSVLEDLEYQLSDLDMARDFHILGGWPLLVSLVSEGSHIPTNETMGVLTRSTEAKIRAVQARAAWAMGTLVKNTEEFFPYSVESIALGDGKTTTAVDVLIDVFCRNYEDSNSWDIRTLQAKSIYALGAMMRGNRLAQVHLVESDGLGLVGTKFHGMVREGFNPANTKLVQRLASLATDVVEDVLTHPDLSDVATNAAIVDSMTSKDWCGATCGALAADAFLPPPVQETLMRAIVILGPHCEWGCEVAALDGSIRRIRKEWTSNKDDFDEEHLQEMQDLAESALTSLHSGASSQEIGSSQ